MPAERAEILSHIPNSGIVQMPGRKFPGIVMQGDTLSNLFDGVRFLLREFKARRDEERYFETLIIAEQLQGQLIHYEKTLNTRAIGLPYVVSIHNRLVLDEFADAEPESGAGGGPPSVS
jgi:hypothetical protein